MKKYCGKEFTEGIFKGFFCNLEPDHKGPCRNRVNWGKIWQQRQHAARMEQIEAERIARLYGEEK